MTKKLVIVLVIIALLAVGGAFGLYYLNTYYLPQVIKAKIIQEAKDKLGIIVQIEDIKLNIFKGIVFYNIRVVNKRDLSSTLEIKRINASFLILPFFKQQKIIFPSISIESPKLNIVRYEDNKFNLEDLIPKGPKTTFQIPLIIYKINIYGSEINFLDKTTQPNFKQVLKLERIKTQAVLSGINFNTEGKLIGEKQTSAIELSGKFQFKTNELKILSRIDKLDASAYRIYLKDLPINIKSLFINNLITECVLAGDTLSVRPNFEISAADLSKDESSLSNAKATISTALTFDLKNIPNFTYLIKIDKLSADLTVQQIPGKIKIDYAKLEIAPDVLDIENAKIEALDTLATVKGKLENFSDPIFKIGLQANLDLATARDYLKNYFDFADSIMVQGEAGLDINISKLKGKKDLQFQGVLNLKNAYLKTKDAPYEIKAINGLVNFNQEEISWPNLSFGFLGQSFNSRATISNLKSPRIALELVGDNISISAKISPAQKNVFNIEHLKGDYFNSSIELSGNLDMQYKNNYFADLNISSQIEISDLKLIKNLPQEIISKINPQGKCQINGRIQGNIRNLNQLNSSLTVSSDELKLYGLRLGYLKMRLIQEDRQIKIPKADCTFYGGSISLNGLVDLEKKDFPYALKIIADNIMLYKLKDDTPIKDKELQGLLGGSVILSGIAVSLPDVKGQGQFVIKDGFLWEFNPLKMLGNFLFIPNYRSMVFKEATADFSIADKKLSTENLTLNSDTISLACKGSIDFLGNLDFEVAPYPVSEEEKTQEEYKGILSGEVAKLAGISIIQLKGTIGNPKVAIKMVPKEVFGKVKEGFKGTFDKIRGIADLIFGSKE